MLAPVALCRRGFFLFRYNLDLAKLLICKLQKNFAWRYCK
nr:MAG TPA: Neuromedin U [Inoviridae sp.]